MTKKIFLLASVLLFTLFVLTAFFRWQASELFLGLTNHDPKISREQYTQATKHYKFLGRAIRISCYIYPVIGLCCSLLDRKMFKEWMSVSIGTFLLSAIALYMIPLLTNGRVGRMDISLNLLSCIIPYLKVFLPCLLLWLIVGKIKKV